MSEIYDWFFGPDKPETAVQAIQQLQGNVGEYLGNKIDREDYTRRTQKVLGQLKELDPTLYRAMVDDNTAQKEAMLNALSFNMDNWTQDPVSREGVKSLSRGADVPFGTERAVLNMNADGSKTAYGASGLDNNQSWFSGLLTRRDPKGQGVLPALLRHEGAHNAIPNSMSKQEEELINRKLDILYGNQNKVYDLADMGMNYYLEETGNTPRGLNQTPAEYVKSLGSWRK